MHLKISPYNLILSALKKAEDSEAVILRFFETKGEATKAELPFDGNRFSLEVKPFEIVTLKIKF